MPVFDRIFGLYIVGWSVSFSSIRFGFIVRLFDYEEGHFNIEKKERIEKNEKKNNEFANTQNGSGLSTEVTMK